MREPGKESIQDERERERERERDEERERERREREREREREFSGLDSIRKKNNGQDCFHLGSKYASSLGGHCNGCDAGKVEAVLMFFFLSL